MEKDEKKKKFLDLVNQVFPNTDESAIAMPLNDHLWIGDIIEGAFKASLDGNKRVFIPVTLTTETITLSVLKELELDAKIVVYDKSMLMEIAARAKKWDLVKRISIL